MNQFVTKHTVKATFDLTGAPVLTTGVGSGVFVPNGAIVTDAFMNVRTAVTSTNSTATVAVQLLAAGDLVAGIAVSGAPWSTTGVKGTLAGSYAEATVAGDTAILDAARRAGACILLTSNKEIRAIVAVEAVLVGTFDVFVEYYL